MHARTLFRHVEGYKCCFIEDCNYFTSFFIHIQHLGPVSANTGMEVKATTKMKSGSPELRRQYVVNIISIQRCSSRNLLTNDSIASLPENVLEETITCGSGEAHTFDGINKSVTRTNAGCLVCSLLERADISVHRAEARTELWAISFLSQAFPTAESYGKKNVIKNSEGRTSGKLGRMISAG